MQSPTSTNSVETQDAFQTTSLLCCRIAMGGVIGSGMPELARRDDDDDDDRDKSSRQENSKSQ